jgi:regulator of nucleoside diphosphate kinase
MPILTHLFNQGGRFLMVCDRNDAPIGFVRLIKHGMDCEVVVAIGSHDNWGRGIGSSAVRQALKLAFLDMRAETVTAKIRPENVRSLKVFERCGFTATSETPALRSLSITAARYRKLLRDEGIQDAARIWMTDADQSKLQELIALENGPAIIDLEHELERAVVVSPQRVPENVVTMNSKVAILLDNEEREMSLVYPEDADESSGKLSVLSEIGVAILGYRSGDTLDWMISDRTSRILINRIIYQPESRGDFHL